MCTCPSLHAAVRALREFPRLNASVLEDAIVEKRDVNIGVAVETEKGLVVPVVRNADRLSLAGLAASIEDLSTRARILHNLVPLKAVTTLFNKGLRREERRQG